MSIAGQLLRPVAELIKLVSQPVHKDFFPFPIFTVLHATRISLMYQAKLRATSNKKPVSWGLHLGGFFLMAWGGSLLSHFVLGLTPPQVYSFGPYINYGTVHILLSLIFSVVDLPNGKYLDTLLPVVDGVLRSGAILAGLSLIPNHPNALIRSSLLTPILISTISAAGSGQLAGALGLGTPSWSFSTPPFLLGGGWVPTLDIWSGIISGLLFGLLRNDHPVYSDFLIRIGAVEEESKGALMTTLGARCVVSLFLGGAYAARTLKVHYWPKNVAKVTSAKKSQ